MFKPLLVIKCAPANKAPSEPRTTGRCNPTPSPADASRPWNAIPVRDEHQVWREDLIIEPGRAERHYWRDLWHYRELFQVLAWRDISVRYKQTVIGAAWALIR